MERSSAATVEYAFVVAGKVNDPNFHKCVAAVKYLEQDNPGKVTVEVLQFFETQWDEYLKKVQTEKKGSFFTHKPSPLIFYNDNRYIGDCDAFTEWVLNEFRYMDKSSNLIYKKKAHDTYKNLIENTPGRQYVYIDVCIDTVINKVLIELFTDLAPQTCENFRKLCNGTFTNKQGEKLTYVGSEFQRIVKGMYIQGGDLYKNGISKQIILITISFILRLVRKL